MRRCALLAALAVAGCGHHEAAPQPSGALGPDRIGYDLALQHRPGRLSGDLHADFRNPASRPIDHVWMRAWANAFGTCAHPRITVQALEGARIGARRRGCTALRVDLPRPVEAGGHGAVVLRFALTVPNRFDRFGRYRGIDFLGNALPVFTVSRDGAEPD